ncbi:adenylyltransferase/cytidyltransferase family protein [Methanothermobacter sp. KEPCO-1]|uniref:adenylyltransferase/cytidyltransferase family protein n=1 Tax=Methanothermobacter sp. KEPCO-1 TaxID=2603820 RepID=UPI0011C9E6C6|nr:adenylyltransferase/cytidyltransferase family protein [Methanothermobacter sp. KEPCO-1]QEF94198.1 adenylyltransferase/cytidyltransferase family protein [Methanothermobacter sp. KEPCO-1]
MIGISADFDPVHLGHVRLIEKGREIADETGDEVVIYLNRDFSANHAPFFVPYEARKEMALAAGADRVVPIDGLHYRLTLAYTVPIRIAMMIEDGVVDYVDAANVSPDLIIKKAREFASRGVFSGIPRDLPNRNVIRWFAVNEFLYRKYGRKMKFHIIPELTVDGSKISGREIRQEIIDNNMEIPPSVQRVLPESTIRILEREIEKGTIPGRRNLEAIMERMNNLSRGELMKIAYLNADAVKSIVRNRKYYREGQIWAAFRKAGYGPVLTRLAMSSIEMNVRREAVRDLIEHYTKKGWIPPDQRVINLIDRAWFVSEKVTEGMSSGRANEMFLEGRHEVNAPSSFEAGLSLRRHEVRSIRDGMDAHIYVDQNDILSCQIRNGVKIRSPLHLSAQMATYLRLIIDSHIIPFHATVRKRKKGFRVLVKIN